MKSKDVSNEPRRHGISREQIRRNDFHLERFDPRNVLGARRSLGAASSGDAVSFFLRTDVVLLIFFWAHVAFTEYPFARFFVHVLTSRSAIRPGVALIKPEDVIILVKSIVWRLTVIRATAIGVTVEPVVRRLRVNAQVHLAGLVVFATKRLA